MKTVKLHVHTTDFEGRAYRKTFVISEYEPGSVDIVEDSRPRCEADRTTPFHVVQGETLVFEVEPA